MLWQVASSIGNIGNHLASSFLTTSNGEQTIVMLTYNGSYAGSEVATLVYLSATSGAVLYSEDVSTAMCGGSWVGKLGDTVGALYCASTTSLLLLDTTTTDGALLANISNFPLIPTTANAETIMIPDYKIGCVVVWGGLTGSMACVSLDPSNPSFGSLLYQYTCPPSSAFAATPVYHSSLQLVVLSCFGDSSNTVTAIDALGGNVSWSRNFTNANVTFSFMQAVYTSQKNYGAVMMIEPSMSTSAGDNFTIDAFSIATGVSVSFARFTAATFPPSEVSALYIVEANPFPVQLTYVLVGESQVLALDSLQLAPVWTYLIGFSFWTGSVLALHPVTQRETVYVSSDSTVLTALDAANGTVLFSNPYEPAWDLGVRVAMTNNNLGVIVWYSETIVYVDVLTQDFAFQLPLTSNGLMVPNGPFPVYLSTGDLAFDVVGVDGSCVQVLSNVSSTNAMLLSNFTVVKPSTGTSSGGEFIVGSAFRSTRLYTPNGTQLWATTIDALEVASDFYFTPMYFAQTTAGYPILIKPMQQRTFVGFNGVDGTLLYAGFLPLCNGQGSGYQKVTTAASDFANGLLYLSVGNPCLYIVNVATGAVSNVVTPKSTDLLPKLIVTDHCIITVDLYGEVACWSKATTNPTVQYHYRFGYVVDQLNIHVKAASSMLVIGYGNQLVSLVESSGQIVFEITIGSHIAFVPFNGDSVIARTWLGVYRIALDPSATKRIMWFTSTESIFGYSISAMFSAAREAIQPIITVNGNAVFSLNAQLVAVSVQSGAVVFVNRPDRLCTDTAYEITAGSNTSIISNVFFTSCGTIQIRSVVDGLPIAYLGEANSVFISGAGNPIQILPQEQSIVYVNQNGEVQVEYLPSYLLAVAPVPQTLPTSAPGTFTLPPNFAPQGIFTPLPTLPVGVTLPKLSCVLNIEALYGDLVTCVNTGLARIYAHQQPNAINCANASETLAPCVAHWIVNIIPNCPGAAIYLSNVLVAMNTTQVFNFCGTPSRCVDGSVGSHAACELVNAAEPITGGATFAPQLVLPQPANQLPSFTIPSNTAGPTTTGPSTTSTTTVAPSTTPLPSGMTFAPSTTTTTTVAPSTNAPITTVAPITNAPITTSAPVGPTTIAPNQMYSFLCVLPIGYVAVPENFAYNVGLELQLTGNAPLATSAISFAGTNPSFTFDFTGDNALQNTNAMVGIINDNPAACAQSLGLQSIGVVTYQPVGGAPPKGGLSSGAVAAIVIVILIAAAVSAVAISRYIRSKKSSRYASNLRGSMIQEEGGVAQPSPTNSEMGSLIRGKESSGPIYSSL